MSFKKIFFSVCILLSNTLYQQEIQPRLDLSAQQAWEYFGNKSTIKPQIIKVQGSQYYNEEFELSDLKYFGRNMESIGYTLVNSPRFRSEDNSPDINGLLIK